MSRETRFHLPLPLDVEPMLERLIGSKALALPFRARSAAAGDYVAAMIRDAYINKVGDEVEAVTKDVMDRHHRKPLERLIAKAVRAKPVKSEKPVTRRAKPPEPDEED